MWNGRKKAVTFSFDDGVTQDVELLKILNDYGLKSTFNLNSGLLGERKQLDVGGGVVLSHNKVLPEQVRELYAGHEVAVHTVSHPVLSKLSDEELLWEVEEDKRALQALVGYEVTGMAYPYGDWNERIVRLLRAHTNVAYARTVDSTYSFALPTDRLSLHPTVHYMDERVFELTERFLATETETPQLFYIWGHAYELDAGRAMDWRAFARLCKRLSGRAELFYGTNAQVLSNE